MIPPHIHTEILNRIKVAEQEHQVKVLFAIESGSRAWGFASPNSDYDVRFVYVHPRDWYLTINLEDKRDVIEYPIVDEIDINGWDLRKALQLLWRSNPSIVEWLHSPIVYIDDGIFAQQARALLPDSYSTVKGSHHYLSMAKGNFRSYLKDEMVPLKKYFYVLRPLLAIKWLEKYQTPAPIEFDRLRELLADQPSVNEEVSRLLEQKKQALEKQLIPQVKALNEFVETKLTHYEQHKFQETEKSPDIGRFNQLFRRYL